jgi:LuxR family maltose regulon positive regulatory protein
MNRYQIKVIQGRITYWPGIVPDSTEWFSWLQQVPSFHFQTRAGSHFTARKESRKRGGVYWIAYRHLQGKLRKQYIGPIAAVTTAGLEEIAGSLETKADPEP